MGIAERVYSKVFAMNEPKGYYELHRVQYQLPKEVQRLEVGNGECQRVTKLNARSLIGVGITYLPIKEHSVISVGGSRGGHYISLGSGVFPHCCVETGRKVQQRNPDPSQKLSEETFLEKIT